MQLGGSITNAAPFMFLLLTIIFGSVIPYVFAEDDVENTKFKKNRVFIGDGPPPPELGKVGDVYIDSSDSSNLTNYKKTGKDMWINFDDSQEPKDRTVETTPHIPEDVQIPQMQKDDQAPEIPASYSHPPVNCSLSIPNANLQGCSFDGQDLSHYDLSGANLNGVSLRNVNMSNANLANANLYGANLYGSNLENADLTGAYLAVADLQFTNLGFTKLERANLIGANLEHAELRETNLSGASLIGTNLKDTTIISPNLTGTIFVGSNPQDSIFVNVNFENTFTDVNKFSNPGNSFTGTFIGDGAGLTGVIAVDSQMLGGMPLSFFLDRSNYTGTWPISQGGTGSTTAEHALASLGAASSTHTHQFSDITGTVLKLTPRNVAPICDIFDRGSVYYDRDDDAFCFCNGMSWKTTDGETCR